MADIFIRAGSFILIIALGYFLKRIGFFKKEDYRLISKIVLNVTLPAAVIVNFTSTDVPPYLLSAVLLGVLGNLVMLGAARIFSGGAPWKIQMFRMLNYSGYSIGCFTLPFIQSFLGPAGVVTTCLFDAGNSVMCSGSTYAIVSEMDSKRQEGGIKISVGRQLKDIGMKVVRSVPLMTYVVMLILSLFHLSLPSPAITLAGIIGSANSFLAMFMIGMMFEIRLVPDKLREMARLLIFRYGISILVAVCFYFLLPLPLEIRQTLVLIVFSPLSALALVYTDRLGCDTELASACNSCTIVISLVVMTALVMVFAV
ncbi:AEC family transporter [Qiania dongpingensis]|uniref:AEC family transporter n=1 Tax=Qiania dongpingensis TaxID=2763669 RepID=A0A7G9G7C2_9FIRM|nr:AEC family transporter [Qiania dongpingensis]QNM06704.1 AEC family transporter [Qiania dongpingensis]